LVSSGRDVRREDTSDFNDVIQFQWRNYLACARFPLFVWKIGG
jgi:hypothetical protein